eukprot:CAMPEP_0119156610 /NCGR_PEP_ID=MMETSP1310-20130426/52344_1 /TAXON_ID=464262 /ORGANISM="Genus nov. species nov., Strain RCC2339" /LENGTH=356 /DNA_ID=CAMNT_0007149225 /DNA_START=32 /DNA_END=1102 /DNA_ORIENTATION=+
MWRTYEEKKKCTIGSESGAARQPRAGVFLEYLDTENLEMASLDSPIKEDNIGYQMMLRMGWGRRGLGRGEEGRLDPVRLQFRETRDFLGIGKREEYEQYNEAATERRRLLNVEDEGNVERQRVLQEKAVQENAIKKVVSEMVRPFYCELCDKQYKNPMEMDKHLNSYDHNHKARFLETKKSMRKAKDKSLRKARDKQEEREMRRLEQQRAAVQASRLQCGVTVPDGKVPTPQGSTSGFPPTLGGTGMMARPGEGVPHGGFERSGAQFCGTDPPTPPDRTSGQAVVGVPPQMPPAGGTPSMAFVSAGRGEIPGHGVRPQQSTSLCSSSTVRSYSFSDIRESGRTVADQKCFRFKTRA